MLRSTERHIFKMYTRTKSFLKNNSDKINDALLPELMFIAGTTLPIYVFDDVVFTFEGAGIDTEDARLCAFGESLRLHIENMLYDRYKYPGTGWSRLRESMDAIFDFKLSIDARIEYVIKNKDSLGFPNLKPLDSRYAFSVPDYDLGWFDAKAYEEYN